MLLLEAIVSCVGKHMLPLDIHHHIDSIHLFYTGISYITRRKKDDNKKKLKNKFEKRHKSIVYLTAKLCFLHICLGKKDDWEF